MKNDQAFPTAVAADDGGRMNHGKPGMTLRTYLAAQAMAVVSRLIPYDERYPQNVATAAVTLADAMLAELAK